MMVGGVSALLLQMLHPELAVTDRTREVAAIVLRQKPDRLAALPVQAVTLPGGGGSFAWLG